VSQKKSANNYNQELTKTKICSETLKFLGNIVDVKTITTKQIQWPTIIRINAPISEFKVYPFENSRTPSTDKQSVCNGTTAKTKPLN